MVTKRCAKLPTITHVYGVSRPLRLELPGGLYHVMARGNNRERIVHDDHDVTTFLKSLATTCQRYAWRVFGWCVMPNHYHLVLETLRPTLSQGMLRQNALYAQRFNRRYNRVGHVFQGRFKALIVEKERYLVTLLRYVELNPWRAGLVKHPTEWPWSSIHVSLGASPPPPWSAVREVWARFDTRHLEAVSSYRAFLLDGMRTPLAALPVCRAAFIGDDHFASEVSARAAPPNPCHEIPRYQRAASTSLADIFAQQLDADAAIKEAYARGFSLRAIADHLGVHYSTVSVIARRNTPRRRRSTTALRAGIQPLRSSAEP